MARVLICFFILLFLDPFKVKKKCLRRLLTLVVKVTTKSWLCVRDVKMYNIHTGEVKIYHFGDMRKYCTDLRELDTFTTGSRYQIFFFLYVSKLLCESDRACWSTLKFEIHMTFFSKLWELDGCVIFGLLPLGSVVGLAQRSFSWSKATQFTVEWWRETRWRHVFGCSYKTYSNTIYNNFPTQMTCSENTVKL